MGGAMGRLSSMTTVRVLALAGFAYGIQSSLLATFSHIGNSTLGPGHTWYHFLREVGLDIGALSALLIILFSAPRYRTPVTWWIELTLMLGYYLPYWIGMPFMAELSPPGGLGSQADWYHIIQAALPLVALFVARRHFFAADTRVREPLMSPHGPLPAQQR